MLFSSFFIGCLIELKICKVSQNSISNWTWKFQLSILKNKKVLFLKKKSLSRCLLQNKKALFTVSILPKVLLVTYCSEQLSLVCFLCSLGRCFYFWWSDLQPCSCSAFKPWETAFNGSFHRTRAATTAVAAAWGS